LIIALIILTFAPLSSSAVQPKILKEFANKRATRQLNAYGFIQEHAPEGIDPTRGQWISLGPNGIQNCGTYWNQAFVTVSGNICSGRANAIAVDPNNASIIYVGTANGGVWKSTNRGSDWVPLTDDQPSLAVGSIAIGSNGVIYVGTGEGNSGEDNYFGVGVLKSTDGGHTWSQLGASTFTGLAFTKIVVDPQNPNIVLATTNTAGFSSTTVFSAYSSTNPPGVYVSRDGGNTWTGTLLVNQNNCPDLNCEASDILLDPSDHTTVYAAVAGGLYVSHDEGTNWNWMNVGEIGTSVGDVAEPGRISLAISGSHLYAALDLIADPNANPPDEGGLIVSSNGGTTWTNVTTPSTSDFSSFCVYDNLSQCWFDFYVAVDPDNTNVIYLGGQDLWRSTDGGNTWTDLGGYVGGLHPDQHAFAFSPISPDTIYVGNDGGIWSSQNASTCDPSNCWINLNAGLIVTEVTSLTAHPTDPTMLFAGSQDNAVWQRNQQSGSWTMLDTGDSGWVAFDSKDPLTMYHTYTNADPSNAISRSTDGGQDWQTVTSGIEADSSEFYLPMAIDRTTDPNTLYLGTYRLYQTTDRGDSWNSIFSLPTDDCTVECISAIAVGPSNGNYVYIGTSVGHVYASSDGGSTFSEADQGLPNASITKIAVDPANPQEVYATFLEFQGPRVAQSQDGGNTWSDISSNIPNIPVTAILLATHGSIYIGTTNGVYVSKDQGASWSQVGMGLPHDDVRDLTFNANNTIIAATYGRGVWALDPATTNSTSSTIPLQILTGAPLQPSANVYLIYAFVGAITASTSTCNRKACSRLGFCG
jgi:photosystem II stability/assembly factor-like uncharacterized protein